MEERHQPTFPAVLPAGAQPYWTALGNLKGAFQLVTSLWVETWGGGLCNALEFGLSLSQSYLGTQNTCGSLEGPKL